MPKIICIIYPYPDLYHHLYAILRSLLAANTLGLISVVGPDFAAILSTASTRGGGWETLVSQ